MSKHDEANLILKLYDLRREDTMRKARDWYVREFNPDSLEYINNTMFTEQGAYLRMVLSYWEMAAALVNHGAISLDLFNDTQGEHMGVYSKIEPFILELRAAYGPQFLTNLEKLIDATPNGRERVREMRERMKAILAQLAARQSAAAKG